MSNPFFEAIATNSHSGEELKEFTNKGLEPFRHYLQNSINAFKDKEVECEWRPVSQRHYEVQFSKKVFEIWPHTQMMLKSLDPDWYQIKSESDGTELGNDFEADISEGITVGKGKRRQILKLRENDYRKNSGFHEVRLKEIDGVTEISWLGYQLAVLPVSSSINRQSEAKINGNKVSIVELDGLTLTLGIRNLCVDDNLKIDGQDIEFEIISQFSPRQLNNDCYDKDTHWLIYTQTSPSGLNNCRISDVSQRELCSITLSQLLHDNHPLQSSNWVMRPESNTLILEAKNEHAPKLKHLTLVSQPSMELRCDEQTNNKNWIQLIEPDEKGESTQSVLDYFFSENAIILDQGKFSAGDAYFVLQTNPEERQLLLAKSKKERNRSIFPTDAKSKLKARADVSQLRKQNEALRAVRQAPYPEMLGLISLFVSREEHRWPEIKLLPIADEQWQILNDDSFDGCLEQREFVKKALATPDFAILDGPPGTGKTTAILELIIQLVREGKRILLTASTHAAINNVLERIDSNELNTEIFPLRIGDQNNAIGVEHYQFDKQLESLSSGADIKISEQLLVDSANLICGTTIGIMRLFNNSQIILPTQKPAFDVMIIDECSKTPFQEFLVPARYAAKHILVGDVRQLSPFTDREQIVANLENLLLRPKRKHSEKDGILDINLQKVCFLIEELRINEKTPYKNQFIQIVNTKEAEALHRELQERKKRAESKELENILLVCQDSLHEPLALIKDPTPLWNHNLCFIEKNYMSTLLPVLPVDAIILDYDWASMTQAFNNMNSFSESQSVHDRDNPFNKSQEIHKHLMQRLGSTGWAEEVCWRLERLYWLRLSAGFDNKTRRYKETIERLLPKSINCEGRVFQLQNIAFPSVLEALSGDGLQKRKNDRVNTLNEGFKPREKSARHTTLSYQHRMHPDISKFPGDQFYKGVSLKDGRYVNRDRHWDYTHYDSHNVWLDVSKSHKNAKVEGNKNKAEVDAVIKELNAFCAWAKGEKNDEDKPYSVAILTFYKGQEKALRNALQKLPDNKKKYSRFQLDGINIKLATVDYFQGQEADIVFLSMVNNTRDGFLDSPNRLNVAITRARYQLIVVGSYDYYKSSRTEELRNLALNTKVHNKELR